MVFPLKIISKYLCNRVNHINWMALYTYELIKQFAQFPHTLERALK
jgi:hypothetical protein